MKIRLLQLAYFVVLAAICSGLHRLGAEWFSWDMCSLMLLVIVSTALCLSVQKLGMIEHIQRIHRKIGQKLG